MNGLMSTITGLGQVSLLSGRIWRYQVGLGLTGQVWLRYAVCAHEPLSRGDGRLGRTRAERLAGPR
jgi:hypothetical protein